MRNGCWSRETQEREETQDAAAVHTRSTKAADHASRNWPWEVLPNMRLSLFANAFRKKARERMYEAVHAPQEGVMQI